MCDGALTQMAKNKGGPTTIHFSNPPRAKRRAPSPQAKTNFISKKNEKDMKLKYLNAHL
jgi:hypothetical protein